MSTFDNMRRLSRGEPQYQFVGTPTSEKKLKLESITKHREGWIAEISEVDVKKGRAIGTLKAGGKVVRQNFSVKINNTDRFEVDVGTGSGVKVAFHLGSNVR